MATEGPQGETGGTGERGPQGDIGFRGLDGVAGEDGADGVEGEPGKRGLTGDQGPKGADVKAEVTVLVEIATELVDRSKSLEASVNNALRQQLKRWRRLALAMGVGFAVLLFAMFNVTRLANDSNQILADNQKGDEDTIVVQEGIITDLSTAYIDCSTHAAEGTACPQVAITPRDPKLLRKAYEGGNKD